MPQKKDATVAVTGMILVILAVALMVPAISISLESPQSDTFDQIEGERVVITGSITSEATDIQTSPNDEVNISLVDEQTGDVVATGPIAKGNTQTFTVANENMNVTVVDVVSSTEAVIQYEYPTYIGYPDNAEVIFQNLPLLVIVATFMMLAGVLLITGGAITND